MPGCAGSDVWLQAECSQTRHRRRPERRTTHQSTRIRGHLPGPNRGENDGSPRDCGTRLAKTQSCEVPALHHSRHLAALDQTRTDLAIASLPKATKTAEDGGNEDFECAGLSTALQPPDRPRIVDKPEPSGGEPESTRMRCAGDSRSSGQGQSPARYDAVGFDATGRDEASPATGIRAPAARDYGVARVTLRRQGRALPDEAEPLRSRVQRQTAFGASPISVKRSVIRRRERCPDRYEPAKSQGSPLLTVKPPALGGHPMTPTDGNPEWGRLPIQE